MYRHSGGFAGTAAGRYCPCVPALLAEPSGPRAVRVAWVLVLALVLAACPRQTRRTLVPEIPQTGDVTARTKFNDARAKFLRDGGGREAFQRIAEEFPGDPIVPWANLYAGIAALKSRKFAEADPSLTAAASANVDPGLTARAELFLGIAKNYLGQPAIALPLLRRGAKAIETEDERTEYLAAAAYATASAGERPLDSLALFDQLFLRVSPTERAVIVARCEEVVARAEVESLRRVFDQLPERRGPAMAAVATRLALLANTEAEAQQLREAAAPARAAVGLPRTLGGGASALAVGGGDAGLLGAVMPLGGKQNRVAEQAVAGLGTASGVADKAGVVAVEVRAAGDAAAAAQAVADLAAANVMAIVGPMEGDAVDAAGARAEQLGVPLLSMSTRPEGRKSGTYVFHVVHSAEHRARALAQAAIAKGVTTFAVLAPDSGYGKAVTAAFVDEVGKGGGAIVISVQYPPDTKSFSAVASKLVGTWQGVFVPEQAERLGLIVPAIAASGRVPKPIGTKKVTGGRPVLLLSTAEGLAGAYIADAGRHSEGALFAPGYYPDGASSGAQRLFLDKFITAFGRAPGAIEAYAYDAALLVAAAGPAGRTGLAAMLSRAELTGVTGRIRFDASHRRADPGVLYTVTQDAGGFAIHAL